MTIRFKTLNGRAHVLGTIAAVAGLMSLPGIASAEEPIGTPIPTQVADGHTAESGWVNHRSDAVDHLVFGLSDGNSETFSIAARDDDEGALLFTIEWRPGVRYLSYDNGEDFTFGIAPFLGGYAGTDESLYGYAGFGLEFVIEDNFVIMPNTAIGAYHRGEGRRLGSTLEFRSGLELAYRWDNDIQLGLAYHHLSNADIGDNNPGTEHLSVFLNIPLDGSIF